MEKVGVLLVSYGSRAASLADALTRSENYKVEIYDADKQKNPFILSRARDYSIGLELDKISRFAEKHKNDLDFGIVGPEGPIIDGVRDKVERELGIPMICPTREYAIEGSKVTQRRLLEKCAPRANPRFMVFDPQKYGKTAEVKKDLWKWLDELDNEVAVKPDKPATGKGVGVWGDHFTTREDLYAHFLENFKSGAVIVEEKIEGEEFSLQCFSDGKRIVDTPCVRDYKRAFDGDLGPNTGGMGCYKDVEERLPFMSSGDWKSALKITRSLFKELKGDGSNPGLRGIPLYMGFTCAADGVKVFEVNSRPGDPEIMNLMPVLKDDFVNTCFDMIDGRLKNLTFQPMATVVTYATPLTYGDYRRRYSGSKLVDLKDAYKLSEELGGSLRIYPGSMELGDDGKTYTCSSRTVACVGIGGSIQEARRISLEGIRAIDGPLWNRWEIGSQGHIQRSIEHVKKLREKRNR
jgi:phosphoribosylamine--glycine ligase